MTWRPTGHSILISSSSGAGWEHLEACITIHPFWTFAAPSLAHTWPAHLPLLPDSFLPAFLFAPDHSVNSPFAQFGFVWTLACFLLFKMRLYICMRGKTLHLWRGWHGDFQKFWYPHRYLCSRAVCACMLSVIGSLSEKLEKPPANNLSSCIKMHKI